MDTFLYSNLNKAARDQDISKIKSLGPFAQVLIRISLIA